MNPILAIAKADFLQRIRSYGFLITLGVCLISAWAIIPSAGATRSGVVFGGARGLNTCAWIGTATTLVFGVYIFFAGFYLISNAIRRDEQTGVGQIIAGTPVRSIEYLTGKTLSNAAVLFSMLATAALVSLLAFACKGEGGGFRPDKALLPLLLIIPPGLILLSGIAVFAEAVAGRFRGAVNIAWFFIWTAALSTSMIMLEKVPATGAWSEALDITGVSTLISRVEREVAASDPAYRPGSVEISFPMTSETKGVFRYQGGGAYGWTWTARWIWAGAALLLLALGSMRFRRFDLTGGSVKSARRRPRLLRWLEEGAWGANGLAGRGDKEPALEPPGPFYALPAPAFDFSLGPLVKSELRLMLLGRPWWWLLVTAGLFVATGFAPLQKAHAILLPTLWFWQILLFSGMGSRETSYRTGGYSFAVPRPLARQLPATLAAVVLFHIALALPVLLRSLFAGNFIGVCGILGGALFLPSLALALGIWTGGSKLFEVVYTILWYALLNKAPVMDYAGALADSGFTGLPFVYPGLGIVCLILAVPCRAHQIRS